MDRQIEIIDPKSGKIVGTVSERNIEKAKAAGYIISNELGLSSDNDQRVTIINPQTNEKGTISVRNLEKAVNAGWVEIPEQKDNNEPAQVGDDWGPLIGKALISGALSIIDLPQVAYSLGKLGVNAVSDKVFGTDSDAIEQMNNAVLPQIPMASDLVKKGIQHVTDVDLTPHPTTPTQRIATHAAEVAGGSLIPLGNIAKGTNLLSKFAKPAIGGAGIGATSGVLQEAGVDPLVADIGATLAMPSVKGIARGLDRGAAKVVGLGKNSIDLPAAQAARNQGINLPAAALTENKMTNFFDHFNKNNAIMGHFHGAKQKNIHQSIDNIIDDIINRTGMMDTPEARKTVKDLYTEADRLLPKDAKVYPVTTHKTAKATQSDLLESLYNSPNEKKVIDATSKILKQIAPYGMKGVETPIKNLIATKRSLNDAIDWTAPRDVKSRVKGIQGAIKDDLRLYGESNPAWHEKLATADKTHGGIEKRLELQELITKATNSATGNKSNYRLAKNLNEPTIKKSIKGLINEQDIPKIDDLGEITRAIYRKEQANPNKSGTATTAAKLKALSKPLTYVPGTALGGLYSALVDNPAFIGRAVDRAAGINRGSPANIPVNPLIQSILGYEQRKQKERNKAKRKIPQLNSRDDTVKYVEVDD